MNIVVLCGNLTKDGELKATHEGNSIYNFTIAVRRSFVKEGQEDVDFVNCSSYGKLADNMSKYLKKGRKVLIQGKLRIDCYKDEHGDFKHSTKIIVDNCTFLNKQDEREEVSKGETMVKRYTNYEDHKDKLLIEEEELDLDDLDEVLPF